MFGRTWFASSVRMSTSSVTEVIAGIGWSGTMCRLISAIAASRSNAETPQPRFSMLVGSQSNVNQ